MNNWTFPLNITHWLRKPFQILFNAVQPWHVVIWHVFRSMIFFQSNPAPTPATSARWQWISRGRWPTKAWLSCWVSKRMKWVRRSGPATAVGPRHSAKSTARCPPAPPPRSGAKGVACDTCLPSGLILTRRARNWSSKSYVSIEFRSGFIFEREMRKWKKKIWQP